MKVKVGEIVMVRLRFSGKERPALVAYLTAWNSVGVQYRRGRALTRARRINPLRHEIVRRASAAEASAFWEGM